MSVERKLSVYGVLRVVDYVSRSDKKTLCTAVVLSDAFIHSEQLDYEEFLSAIMRDVKGNIFNICRMELSIWNDDFPKFAISEDAFYGSDVLVVDLLRHQMNTEPMVVMKNE